MPKIRHPLSGVIYDVADDGTITLEKEGRTGHFSSRGEYLDGEIKTADPQLCGWIGGVQLPSRHQQVAEASLFADRGTTSASGATSATDDPTTPGGGS